MRFNGGETSRSVKASSGRSSEGIEKTDGGGGGARQFAGPAMEVTILDRGFANSTTVNFPVWDKIGAIVRLTYGIGEYVDLQIKYLMLLMSILEIINLKYIYSLNFWI